MRRRVVHDDSPKRDLASFDYRFTFEMSRLLAIPSARDRKSPCEFVGLAPSRRIAKVYTIEINCTTEASTYFQKTRHHQQILATKMIQCMHSSDPIVFQRDMEIKGKMVKLQPNSNRIALVTGASRGMGRSAALALSKMGVHVFAAARDTHALHQLSEEARLVGGTPITTLAMDLRDISAIEQASMTVEEKYGRLDVLIAAAGEFFGWEAVADTPVKHWDALTAINLTANFHLIRVFDRLIRKSRAARVVFVSSMAARAPRALMAGYSATKAGLEALVACYAQELSNTMAAVYIVCPGPMRTAIRAKGFPNEDPTTLPHPDEIVPLFLELTAEDCTRPFGIIRFPDWRNAQAKADLPNGPI